ncbi:MAG: ferredoxin family protein [Curvibacter sp.]|nr:ferredoxin family protein [Curvibacter sp.]
MIEFISTQRCTGCNICVQVCPTAVFEAVPQDRPRLARQTDCQTCFMCELYCPEDALYVSPLADRVENLGEIDGLLQAQLGSYRRAIGWGRGQAPAALQDRSQELLAQAH